MLELGRALSLAGTGVSETQERLTRIAAASGGPDARVVVLPTALMIAFGRAGWATIESTPQHAGTSAIHAMAPRHGVVVTVFAYAIMTVGLCLVLEPSPLDVAVAGVFGGIVLVTRGRLTLTALARLSAAFRGQATAT